MLVCTGSEFLVFVWQHLQSEIWAKDNAESALVNDEDDAATERL